jgi:acetyl-CoA carboxylase, biotin carboxylase subunit
MASQSGVQCVLVANRGEIAVRVLRACKELGIKTVAVYSEADRDSMHVRAADRAVCIGPAPSAQSYLDQKRMVAAAVAFGADAIHPGYGFLSEKASFAELCENEGIVFVGPSSNVISLMGDKIAARRFAKRAGVPTTPGSDGAVSDPDEAEGIANQIGFPVLLKAAAGGGGRGMRIVERLDDLRRLFLEATSEAGVAFGDPSVYIERYLTNVRHVEIQVLGDGQHVVHLGERDCSTQSRNQKLVEEAPSPALDSGLRERIAEAAVKLCSEVGYKSAGTVEFIFDQDSGEFYFMEMNTRIQVEHPVTEMVTGLDLVKEQLRIACGGALELRQSQLKTMGHAIECRINAEDYERGFAPSPGRISKFVCPGGPGVRVDTHIEAGYTVPPFYDSLLAKIVCWGRDRQEAIQRMLRALDEMQIEGIKTTIPFHKALLMHEAFRAGRVNTRFVHDVLGY